MAAIGAGFSFVAQSSSVAAAVAVAGVGAGLLDLPASLPLIAGANAAAIGNNLLMVPGENAAGRLVFVLQAIQKLAGSLLLAAFAVASVWWPSEAAAITGLAGSSVSAQIAVMFMVAQLVGALAASLTAGAAEALIRRLAPPSPAEALAQPAFLLREALNDPPAALDLAMRELARLSARLPLLLDGVRAEPEPGAPQAASLRAAGTSLADAIKAYLAALLDGQPTRAEVATALLLEDAAGHAGALHEALAELAAAAAAVLPTTGRLVEALHALLTVVADHAGSLGADIPNWSSACSATATN
jgi:phosphate:Na+ symporter